MTDHQDWQTVTFKKKQSKPANPQKAVEEARKEGKDIETVKKFNAGTNHQQRQTNALKVEREVEEGESSLSFEKVSLSLAKTIQQARQTKGLTQKELGTKISEKASVINDYESGRAVPSQQILIKLERELGVKLRGIK